MTCVVLISLICLFLPTLGCAQPYTADWQSLDQRATPAWWQDAKFGIFIHWGVYSVPAYSPKGTYAEWYWERINANGHGPEGDEVIDMENSDQVFEFHKRHYGENSLYEGFVPQFKAELFDPDQWADIFKRAGAQYVVLTSKHHEGFTLWPSEHADKSWGRPWSAGSTGPKRDLAGDLTEAVRGAGLRMGFYYSLSEWYNPIYRRDVSQYVDTHMLPQLKDLVNSYDPDIIFADGEWGHSSDVWKSKEFLAWLYNRSGSDQVVVNDRWGSETRHKHGGYYTTEYGAGLPDASDPWEESRGMGTSYGYNRIESAGDYNSSQELVLTLIDTVSRGGNFLLNIGPTADGRVPVIMEDRLLSMGRWLKTNGEAIYGTVPWHKPVQWGEGTPPKFNVETHGFVKYDIIQQTIKPSEGQAAKEVFFTQKGNTLYAILPRWHETIELKDVSLNKDAVVSLLATGQILGWESKVDSTLLKLPAYDPNAVAADEQHAYVIKLTGIKKP